MLDGEPQSVVTTVDAVWIKYSHTPSLRKNGTNASSRRDRGGRKRKGGQENRSRTVAGRVVKCSEAGKRGASKHPVPAEPPESSESPSEPSSSEPSEETSDSYGSDEPLAPSGADSDRGGSDGDGFEETEGDTVDQGHQDTGQPSSGGSAADL